MMDKILKQMVIQKDRAEYFARHADTADEKIIWQNRANAKIVEIDRYIKYKKKEAKNT